MDIESETSDSNLVIVTKRDRVKMFCKYYWRTILIITFAIALLPIAFVGNNYAYLPLYVFLLTVLYWIFDVMHPAAVAMIPIAFSIFIGYGTQYIIGELHVRNDVLNCFGVMVTIVAIENSRVHRRFALKLLLMVGCSHYRLSFLLFFATTLLSMIFTSTLATGLMIPIVKAVLTELERMGILDVYQNISKVPQKRSRHEQAVPKPTDFTIFYYLGIAYSSSIGSMVTVMGSESNELLKYYTETIFPFSPKLEFPHIMLLNLPGVLIMESILYLWMNFYFMGMFRAESEIALAVGMTEEEAQYIRTLLSTQYHQLGKIKFHEIIVAVIVALTMVLQATRVRNNGHTYLSSPIILCVILYFLVPTNLDFIKFFRRKTVGKPFPTGPSKACMSWGLITSNIRWSILFIVAGSCTIFDVLIANQAREDVEKAILLLKGWPAPTQALVIIFIGKLLSELGNNSCVVHVIMPSIARLCVESNVSPYYLMSAASLAVSVPVHLATGTAANAMVLEYVHIPHWKMMHAGLGPSLFTMIVMWFTIALWTKAIWPDINVFPSWARDNTLVYPDLTRRHNTLGKDS